MQEDFYEANEPLLRLLAGRSARRRHPDAMHVLQNKTLGVRMATKFRKVPDMPEGVCGAE